MPIETVFDLFDYDEAATLRRKAVATRISIIGRGLSVPSVDASEVWARLDAHPPTVIAILKPDHVRNVDRFAKRYKARPFGPYVFDRVEGQSWSRRNS